MKRSDFDHAIRAAAGVLDVSELLVIGSQAALASLPDPLPIEAQRSVEVDVVPFDDPDGLKADLVDGTIGEASIFHESFGVYAQGVSEATAVLPDGWRDRLVRYESPGTSGVVAWCLELHDLWISKAVAGRDKDREFCEALLRDGNVDSAKLLDQLTGVSGLEPAVVERITAWVGSESGT
ncbi:MAG: hypothetical protein M5U31_07480 [Acidimicrobiia bacterium]|nr:hypothetical protein [Acidimicrobiia bacterium]